MIITVIVLFFNSQFNKVKKGELPQIDNELKISDNAANLDPGIINIAFYGIDRRVQGEASRSDAIMVVAIDQKHKKVKISSIMRDSYVGIEGYGKTKINHAYAYGGPSLSIKTLNNVFDLNIRDYVMVDFYGLEKIIDKVGGITLNIRQDEIKWINDYIAETAGYENIQERPFITRTGEQVVNGMQAVAYTRIRYTSGGDEERTQRQRTVLISVLNKVKNTNIIDLTNIVSELLPYTETSMSNGDIINVLKSIYTFGINNIVQDRFPRDGYCEGKTINGVWYLVFDLEATKKQLHEFIFEE